MSRARRVVAISVSVLAWLTAAPPAALGSAAAGAPDDYYVVGFRSFPRGLAPGQRLHGGRVERADPVLHFARVRASAAAKFLQRARSDPRVRYVEPDPEMKLIEYTPNDPQFSGQYGPQLIRAPQAWDTTLGDMDATVCVVDTGVRYTHEDITGARWLGGTDFYNGDNDPWDDNGHGTHVTGSAAASIDNAKGIAGIGNVGIYGVKALGPNGAGSWSMVASAVRWCADNGGPRVVINLSLAGGIGATVLQDAVQYAYGRGALLVAAAGNAGPCSNCVSYPAAYPEVIAVTCVDSSKLQCSFSSDGPQSELTAPGLSILSLWHTGDTAYNWISGTSMSTPHVAGTAALVWSDVTGLTNADLRQRLRDNAQDLAAAGWDEEFGYGLVDAGATLGGTGAPAPPPPPESRIFFEDFDDGAANGWTLTGLWHVSGVCSTPPSTPNSLNYNRDSDCTYNTGSRNTGTATFDVDLTGRTAATLNFSHRFQKESWSGGAYDIMRVQVSTNGGATWTSLRQWDSRLPNQLAWTAHSVDLDVFAGQGLKIRFFFDTVDHLHNNFAGWFLDDVEVTADVPTGENRPPVANAGPDRTVADSDASGDEAVTLDGSGSSDPDGTIVSYEWREGGTTIATGATPTVTFAVGAHTVTLTVTDDAGATASDDVVITVAPNTPPVANAGPDRTVADADASGDEAVTLDGSGSSDPDGTIVSYEWREGGTLIATGPTPSVTLAVGTHTVDLTVTDNGGAAAGDAVVVTVNPNQPPTASFTYTTSGLTVNVNGSGSSDPDGTITSYSWDWGDGSPTASGVTASHTYGGAGTYTVTLTVTDNGGATGSTSRSVTVTVGPTRVFFEDFDDGIANGWTLTGLWHVSGVCSTPPSTPNSLNYNRDSDCTYNTGSRNTGTATFDVDLTGRAAATLNFSHRFQKENYAAGAYDIMRVQVSTNGGATWTSLRQWDSRNANQLAWTAHSVGLDPYVGGAVKIRFFFDTVDHLYNNFAGWFLDDVEVTAD